MYTTASVLVTEDCNLRCTYCFETHKQKRMSEETASQTLDFLISEAKRSGDNRIGIMLFGGEPTLVPEICSYLISEGYRRTQENNLGIGVSLITNCTGLPDILADTIKEYLGRVDFNIQLSIDGHPEVQDKYRITKQGGRSWPMVYPTVNKWKEVLGDKYKKILNVHGCMNAETIGEYYNSYIFFRDVLEIPMIWFLPVCEEDWTDEHVKIYEEQVSLIYDEILERVRKTGSHDEIHAVAPFDRRLQGCRAVTDAPCGAGKSYSCITSQGDLYPCHQFYYHDDGPSFYMGNIVDGVDEERARLFVEYDGGDLSCSNDCSHGHCYRCIAVNWFLHGSFLTQKQGKYCEMMKIDEKFQINFEKEVKAMGLLNNEEQCRVHSEDTSKGCDIVINPEGERISSECDLVGREPEKEKCSGGCEDCTCGDSKPDDAEVLVKILMYQKKIFHAMSDLGVDLEYRNRK